MVACEGHQCRVVSGGLCDEMHLRDPRGIQPFLCEESKYCLKFHFWNLNGYSDRDCD